MSRYFDSDCRKVGACELPAFSGTRVMMLPVVHSDSNSVPDFASHYLPVLDRLWGLSHENAGQTVYLTVDEKRVVQGRTLRRAGVHVDGVYGGGDGGWARPVGGWASVGGGMLTVSSPAGCVAWRGRFEGFPGPEGECEHLRNQLAEMDRVLLGENEVWWLDGLCVHESMPMSRDTKRAFVRLSSPTTAPWFDGYTENPLGVQPDGPVLPRREFMDV